MIDWTSFFVGMAVTGVLLNGLWLALYDEFHPRQFKNPFRLDKERNQE